MQQLAPSCKRSVLVQSTPQVMQKMPEAAARAAARGALDWLEQQPGVVEAVAAAMAITRPQQQQHQSQQVPNRQKVEALQNNIVKAQPRDVAAAAMAAAAPTAAALMGATSAHGQYQQQQQQYQGHEAAAGSLADSLSGLVLEVPPTADSTADEAAAARLAAAAEKQYSSQQAAAAAAAHSKSSSGMAGSATGAPQRGAPDTAATPADNKAAVWVLSKAKLFSALNACSQKFWCRSAAECQLTVGG
jgi:hypothetical protein